VDGRWIGHEGGPVRAVSVVAGSWVVGSATVSVALLWVGDRLGVASVRWSLALAAGIGLLIAAAARGLGVWLAGRRGSVRVIAGLWVVMSVGCAVVGVCVAEVGGVAAKVTSLPALVGAVAGLVGAGALLWLRAGM
jgi:hypothetical protein